MVKNILKIILSAIIAYPILVFVEYLDRGYDKSTWIVALVIEILIAGALIYTEIRKHNKGDKE